MDGDKPKFPNIGIRRTIALVATIVLVFATVWALVNKDKDLILMLIPFWISVPNWYFSKSTALDQPGGANTTPINPQPQSGAPISQEAARTATAEAAPKDEPKVSG
jgi:hypothetical protein